MTDIAPNAVYKRQQRKIDEQRKQIKKILELIKYAQITLGTKLPQTKDSQLVYEILTDAIKVCGE